MSAQGLPAHILALFTPRPPPQHLPAQVVKRPVKLTGVADFVEYFSSTKPEKRPSWESPKERKERRAKEKLKAHKEELKALTDKYDPHKDANASGDPFKTLFVARISYDTTEKKLKREFEVFGSIKRVRMIYDLKGKPRGYAFIEFEHERDLKNAYKQGDGKKIDGRRVMVDVERGRTVEGWLPRRLGGGRGPGRQGKPSKKKKKTQAAAAAAAEAGDKETKEKEEKTERRDKDRGEKDRGEKDRGEKDRGEKDRGEKDRGEKDRGDKERATAAPAGGTEGRKERDKEKDRDRGDRERKKDDKEDKRGRDDKKKDKKEKAQKERSRSRDRDRDRDRDREHVKKKSRRED